MAHDWKVLFPIDYRSGGDTTSQAFMKHINEIDKIYEHLNTIDIEKAGSDEIKNQISSAIGNLSLGSIKGSLDGSRITGSISNATIDGSKITGSINASRVTGNLTNATIDGSKITGSLPSSTIGDVNASNIKGNLTNATIDASRVSGLESYLKNSTTFISSVMYPVGATVIPKKTPFTVPGSSSTRWMYHASFSVLVSPSDRSDPTAYMNNVIDKELNGGTEITTEFIIRLIDGRTAMTGDIKVVTVNADKILSERPLIYYEQFFLYENGTRYTNFETLPTLIRLS